MFRRSGGSPRSIGPMMWLCDIRIFKQAFSHLLSGFEALGEACKLQSGDFFFLFWSLKGQKARTRAAVAIAVSRRIVNEDEKKNLMNT